MIQRGEDLVVSVELVDVERQAQLWGGRFNRKMTDLVALQEELATEISEKLRLQLTGEDKKRLRKRPTQNNEAYRLVLMAQHYLAASSAERLRKGVAFCQQAIEIDPTYAAAHARLSMAYSFLRFYGHAEVSEAVPGMMAARRALDLDETLADAHIGMGWNLLYLNWDPHGAEREAQRALELDPDSADGWALLDLIRLSQGRADEACCPEDARSNWRRSTGSLPSAWASPIPTWGDSTTPSISSSGPWPSILAMRIPTVSWHACTPW